jgi:5,10-methylene-tetrahydrofolate dehydrogenase/methenyl tetrahydrofolate cyclohydrolase
MKLLDGKVARNAHTEELKKGILGLGFSPILAIIQVGDNSDSTLYIEQKKKFAVRIGATARHIKFPERVSFAELSGQVEKLNLDEHVHGIIIQLPLPPHLDREMVVALINPKKDVDGLTPENQALLAGGHPRFVPATARGILSLLDFYKIGIKGKKIAVLGRSRLVGGSTALALTARGGDVTICHSKTTNTREITRASDIVIVAIGKPELIDASYVRDSAVVVDVGINSTETQNSKLKAQKLGEEIPRHRLVGDVDYAGVSKVAGALSPVPGGVGPMTVLSLFENLLDASNTAI